MTKLSDVILRDIAGNRPTAGVEGRLFYDTTNEELQRDNGSSWETCEPTVTDGGATEFTDLSDVPSGYSGQARKQPVVNSGETALEFAVTGTIIHDETVTGSPLASLTITVPSWAGRLQVDLVGQTSQASNAEPIKINLNSDTGNNYDSVVARLKADGAVGNSNTDGEGNAYIEAGLIPGSTAPANCAAVLSFMVFLGNGTFYTSMTGHGYARTNTGDANVNSWTFGGTWRSTATVTSIVLAPAAGSFVVGTRLRCMAYP